MGKCVYCGNLSNNKKKATLHRFPRDAALCKQWVKIIGWENWMPTNSSLLCSDHFSENCFNVYRNRKYLKLRALPTILTPQEMFQEHSNILVESNHGNINESIATIKEVPEADMCVESIDSPTRGREIFDEESYLQSSTLTMNVTKSQHTPVHEKIRHDHHYTNTPRCTLKKLKSIQERLHSTQKSNQILKRQIKRLKVKVHSLKEVAKGLKEKKLLD